MSVWKCHPPGEGIICVAGFKTERYLPDQKERLDEEVFGIAKSRRIKYEVNKGETEETWQGR